MSLDVAEVLHPMKLTDRRSWIVSPMLFKTQVSYVSLACIIMFSACVAADRISYGPTIGSDPDWKMLRECGYEHCYPLVDFLNREDVSIRIELLWGNRENFPLVILARFSEKIKGDFTFDSSVAIVKFANGRILKAKGLSCAGTLTNLSYLRSAPGLSGPISVEKNACFYLFFDSPSPRPDEEFTLILNGIMKKGVAVRVPDIVLRNRLDR